MNTMASEQLINRVMQFFTDEAVSIVVSLVILYGVNHLIQRLANSFVHDDRRRFSLKKWARYITAVAALVWIMLLYNASYTQFHSFHLYILGFLFAGLAFTMRGLFSDILGWMIIATHKSYHSGDRVEIGDIRGDVIDVGVLRTTLAEVGSWEEFGEQSTGRLISVPNKEMLNKSVVNYNRGFNLCWSELSVTVTFESDWKKAEELLNDIAMIHYEEHRERFQAKMLLVKREQMIRYTYITPKVFTKIDASGVTLTLRQMVEVRQRRVVQDQVFREILNAFHSEPTVEFAYNTMRLFKHGEGA